MSNNQQVAPSVTESAFNCPHCGAYAFQRWHTLGLLESPSGGNKPPVIEVPSPSLAQSRLKRFIEVPTPSFIACQMTVHQRVDKLYLSVCYRCSQVAVWVRDTMQWPKSGDAPAPNEDLPEDVRKDYLEAGVIIDLSPRGAAALLRLAIQKLCVHLGGKGENINDDIAALVKKGLDELIQQALDAVRVIGNNAVHPGQIDLNDNREMATSLFGLVNLITEVMISRPKHVKAMYSALPAGALAAIQKRDGKQP